MDEPAWLHKPMGEWTDEELDEYCRDTKASICASLDARRALRELGCAVEHAIPGLHRLLQWARRPVDSH